MNWRKPTASTAGPYIAKAFLLSHAELRFFQTLLQSVGRDVYVVAKVRLADLVGCTDPHPLYGTLGRIAQKHVDFVLVDERYTRILGAIELDDSSHEQAKTVERDRFVNDLLNSLGIPLLRVQAAMKYNPMVLRQQLAVILRPTLRVSINRRATTSTRDRPRNGQCRRAKQTTENRRWRGV